MIDDLWPTFKLAITTPRLQLRVPREAEIAQLAELAGRGIHHDSERPFLTPWTDGSAKDRAEVVLQSYWSELAEWRVDNWSLGMGAFTTSGEPVGMVTLRAQDFPVVREVTTTSWLGLQHHGQGLGTEARKGILTLAFDHLGADAARSEVFQDNHASQAISRKLGYQFDGISRDSRGSEVLTSDRLRLSRSRWADVPTAGIVLDGIDACRHMFEG
ncbi:N-acetyltransferase [Actinobacteria bacterium YIM 96077]|uniref:GNAT family N-acetyltransferase n=1 Tax=Phytoactinopolyspora halophila TaxID=1981511 RepID=A0A329QRA1_9ACTN|nr:GNAT family N-acetyltransferase [Phytoactinopolyspora halophila]AYY14337.1 N-acetyltransferase [Actinobacteria bacterium YIM 96077]RAW14880.1 GNAT family N-acetyltransferase [Phytoactinopolyspora halophila]